DELRLGAMNRAGQLAAKQVIAARLLNRGVQQLTRLRIPERERCAERFAQGGRTTGQLGAVIYLKGLRCDEFSNFDGGRHRAALWQKRRAGKQNLRSTFNTKLGR